MKSLALGIFALLLLPACSPAMRAPGSVVDGPIHVLAASLPLDPADPEHQRLGDFVFAGALYLTSPETALFGGFSDLKVTQDGHFVSESDEGSLMRGHIVLGPDGRLAGLDQTSITRLKGLDGQVLSGKFEADSEGVAVWPNGDLMVSFEHDHRIWVYPAAGGPPHAVPRPQVDMPENKGMEGLALAPREGPDAYWVGIEGGEIWLCHLAKACERSAAQFPPAPGYRLPALFEMANGDLVVEHHHHDDDGTRIVVSVIDNPAANPAPRTKAQLVLASPLTVDNIEGVAVVSRPGGVQRFYLISDDNFAKRDQRTLLIAFDWTPPGKPTP